jgi:osmoprotectant transport system ATP-binding protein
MIEFRRVSKRFDRVAALRDIDLTIAAGQTTVLIGPSGCGKSTLLRLINGLIRADEGEIVFEDQPLTEETVRAARLKIGYVIQDGGLFPHLTARRNVSLMAEHLGWPRDRIDQRITELSEFVRLPAAAINRFPAELSGGQQQRVSLMRALMLDPDVLLLDEPLGALDPMIRASLQTELRDIFRTLGKTAVMVTHDLAEAGFFGHTIVLLRAGQVIQTGPFQDLLREPADDFVSEFVSAQRSAVDVLSEADA